MPWEEVTHIDQLKVGDVIKHYYKGTVRYGRVTDLYKREGCNWVKGPFSSNLKYILKDGRISGKRKVFNYKLRIRGDRNKIYKLTKKTPFTDEEYKDLWV